MFNLKWLMYTSHAFSYSKSKVICRVIDAIWLISGLKHSLFNYVGLNVKQYYDSKLFLV